MRMQGWMQRDYQEKRDVDLIIGDQDRMAELLRKGGENPEDIGVSVPVGAPTLVKYIRIRIDKAKDAFMVSDGSAARVSTDEYLGKTEETGIQIDDIIRVKNVDFVVKGFGNFTAAFQELKLEVSK